MRERLLKTLTIFVGMVIAAMFMTDGAVIGIHAQDTTANPAVTATPHAVVAVTAQAAGESANVIDLIEPLAQTNETLYVVIILALLAVVAFLGWQVSNSTPNSTVDKLWKSRPTDEQVITATERAADGILNDGKPGNDFLAPVVRIAGKTYALVTPDEKSVKSAGELQAISKSQIEAANAPD